MTDKQIALHDRILSLENVVFHLDQAMRPLTQADALRDEIAKVHSETLWALNAVIAEYREANT